MSTKPLALFILILICGCQQSAAPPASPAASSSTTSTVPAAEASPAQPPRVVPTISLGPTATGSQPVTATTGESSNGANNAGGSREAIVAAMQGLQILLGEWKGTTQREFGDFKALDQPSWVWDFLTDREQPALVMTSGASPYFRTARLSFVPGTDSFSLETTDAEGQQRRFEGKFTQPVEEFQGDDRRVHKRYKLELTQTDAANDRDAWQVVFNQQDNNRYLLELARRRGANFLRFDTVATQRAGTSFGKSDDSYGERECIISGGLGTIQVSYEGKNYYVCCTGCKAAFDEDPATWVKEFLAKKQP